MPIRRFARPLLMPIDLARKKSRKCGARCANDSFMHAPRDDLGTLPSTARSARFSRVEPGLRIVAGRFTHGCRSAAARGQSSNDFETRSTRFQDDRRSAAASCDTRQHRIQAIALRAPLNSSTAGTRTQLMHESRWQTVLLWRHFALKQQQTLATSLECRALARMPAVSRIGDS